MSINAEVSKSGSESTLSVIRKFSRRVQGTGLVKNARKTRYYERAFRDIYTGTQHAFISEKTYIDSAQVKLGLAETNRGL